MPINTGWHFCRHPHKPEWLLRWIDGNQAYVCKREDLPEYLTVDVIERGHIAQYAEMVPVTFPPPHGSNADQTEQRHMEEWDFYNASFNSGEPLP